MKDENSGLKIRIADLPYDIKLDIAIRTKWPLTVILTATLFLFLSLREIFRFRYISLTDEAIETGWCKDPEMRRPVKGVPRRDWEILYNFDRVSTTYQSLLIMDAEGKNFLKRLRSHSVNVLDTKKIFRVHFGR